MELAGLKELKVSDVHTNDSPVSVESETLLKDALGVMKSRKIGSIVIVSTTRLVQGIFTERDYLEKIAGSESTYLDQPISEVMTPSPKTVLPSDSLYRVLVMMRMGRFRHMIVADKEGHLVKVLSIKDMLDYLLDSNGPEPEPVF